MNPIVSIIIPVFKAKDDIERCCKALFGQSLEYIEYIFVDDCSPDDSISIIKRTLELFPDRKPFVKILHQEKNSGVSACRQMGLDNAKGDYIIHCDSDDWPELDMYEKMYNTAINEAAEVVCCDYLVEYSQSSSIVRFPDQHIEKPSFNIGPIEGAVWNKLIKRELIGRCGAKFFQGVNLGEDFGFVTICRVMSKKNAVVHEPLYHYNQLNQNSITHTYKKERFLQVVDLAKRVDDYFIEHGLEKEYEKGLNYLKFQAKGFFLIFKDTRDIKLWSELFPECHNDLWEYNYPTYAKVVSWMIVHKMKLSAMFLLSLKSLVTNT